MHAAVYARLSVKKKKKDDDAETAEQKVETTEADEAAERSVPRQIEQAKAYAQRKGWTVTDEHIFADDGVSGAEFANRPDFVRLMNALKPRAGFEVLIVSELSRLGREQLETGYAVKQLSQVGGRLVTHARYYWLLLAESHLARGLFGSMLQRIWALPVPAG